MAATKTRKRRRSAKQKANDKRLGAMARARHRGKTTKTRAKRKARRASKAKASTPVRRRRRSRRRAAAAVSAPIRRKARGRRRGRRAGRRAKHRAKHSRRGKSRGKRRSARRSARIAFINPRGMIGREVTGFLSGITHVKGNMHAAMKNGIKGYAAAAGGAVGAVFVGTVLARFVMPAALKFAPKIAGSPIGARVLSFGLYYTGAYAIARFTPGIKQSTRDAIMFGGLVAAVLEIVKPGIIAKAVGYIPGVGPVIAPKLEGIESELSDYVESALNGLGFTNTEYDGRNGFHGVGSVGNGGNPGFGRSLSELSNYAMGSYVEAQPPGVGNYAMGAYQEMDGLGCPAGMNMDDGA